MKKPKVIDVHVRLPHDLHQKLAASAAKNVRPISSELIVLLREVLK